MQLEVFMEADGMVKDIPKEKIVFIEQGETLRVGALGNGMTSGKASVAFGFPLPDGRYVIAETSMRLFLTAAMAFATKYDDDNIVPKVPIEGSNRTLPNA